jgi:hypothetical protein
MRSFYGQAQPVCGWRTGGNFQLAFPARGLQMVDLETVIDQIIQRHPKDSGRLQPLANYLIERFSHHGLPGLTGGSTSELRIPGLARHKDWDVAYDFAGKPRLLVSLKSIWANAGGTVPNRLDDLMGESANAQQMSPELVIGYVMLFDTVCDKTRKEDQRSWSAFLEERLSRISIRKAPLWNQGLIEGSWLLRFNSNAAKGSRVPNLSTASAAGDGFIQALLAELHLREPAITIIPRRFPRGEKTSHITPIRHR